MTKKKKVVSKVPAQVSSNGRGRRIPQSPIPSQRTYSILDYRLEKPSFSIRQIRQADETRYEVTGDLSAPVPPIRESRYLDKKQCIEIYRWMLLNRKMETALENLYKQGKVVGEFTSVWARKLAPVLPLMLFTRTSGLAP